MLTWITHTLVVFTLASGAGPTVATNGFDVPWFTTAGGGMSQGGDFHLKSTIAQTDASVLAGGVFVLSGGFWSVTREPTFTVGIFCDGFESGDCSAWSAEGGC